MSADKNSGIGLLCQESERLGMESDIKKVGLGSFVS
ncbi:hypothetical protein SAMN05192541_14122 [Bradyrhizobium arachidis]|nr:hypothetical protein SAMN05192541_14122 [Bradyrhizobium arachidis]